MKTITTLFAALMISALGFSSVKAEDAKKEAPKPVPQATAQPGQLTDESLKEMLELLGYDFKIEKSGANTLHYVKVTRAGTTYEMNVNLSGSKTKLWTSVCLGDLKAEQATQADKLLKLLELNQKIGPSHFYYYPPHKQIYIAKPLDNRGVTAKLLREHIDQLMESIISNRTAWETDKWAAPTNLSKTE